MAEWKPVVGGRAWWLSAPCSVVFMDEGLCGVGRLPGAIDTYVDAGKLTEHPDDARHRRLLEAARQAGKTWAAMRNAKAPRLQAAVKMAHAAAIKELRAIIAECDAEESTDA